MGIPFQASFGMELLLWVASVASQPENAQRTLVGHGGSGNAETFTFGLAKYMLVTRSMADVSLVLFRILCYNRMCPRVFRFQNQKAKKGPLYKQR